MKIFALLFVGAIVSAVGWQLVRYWSARRGPVQDEQQLVYSGSAFHVVTFISVGKDDDAMELLQKPPPWPFGPGAEFPVTVQFRTVPAPRSCQQTAPPNEFGAV